MSQPPPKSDRNALVMQRGLARLAWLALTRSKTSEIRLRTHFVEEKIAIRDHVRRELDIIARIDRDAPDRCAARRAIIRAQFALLEIDIAHLRQNALLVARVGERNTLDAGEMAILEGREYWLKENGTVGERESRLSFLPLLHFVFNALAKASEVSFSLNKNKNDLLKKAIEVRNRVTHPKSQQDLTVTDADVCLVNNAVGWVMEQNLQLLQLCAAAKRDSVKSWRRRAERMTRAVDHLRKGNFKLANKLVDHDQPMSRIPSIVATLIALGEAPVVADTEQLGASIVGPAECNRARETLSALFDLLFRYSGIARRATEVASALSVDWGDVWVDRCAAQLAELNASERSLRDAIASTKRLLDKRRTLNRTRSAQQRRKLIQRLRKQKALLMKNTQNQGEIQNRIAAYQALAGSRGKS